jgi:hypothetical protein
LAEPLGLTAAGVVAIAAGMGLNRVLPALLLGPGQCDDGTAAQAAFALMILGWGPLMAYQLGNIPALEALTVVADPGSAWSLVLGGGELSLMAVSRLAIIVVAAILAAITLARVRALAIRRGTVVSGPGWAVLGGSSIAYTAVALLVT